MKAIKTIKTFKIDDHDLHIETSVSFFAFPAQLSSSYLFRFYRP